MDDLTERLGVAEAKRDFSALLDRTAAGGSVVITRHGKPVAALGPPGSVKRLPQPGGTGFAALAGALAEVDDFDEIMRDVVASRQRARDRPAPDLG